MSFDVGQPVDAETFAAIVHNIDPRKVSKDEILRRLKEASKKQPDLDVDALKSGDKVRVPRLGVATIEAIDGENARVRLDGGKTIETDVFELKPPPRPVQVNKGENLTPRRRKVAGADWMFAVPKSVSLAIAAGDKRLLEDVEGAVYEAMDELVEPLASVRVRQGSGDNQMDEQKHTGELLWAPFFHDTSRPVERNGKQIVDAQYHIHCYIHNVTWDHEAEGFKALKAERMESHKPLVQERFFSSLARRVFKRGYDVERRSISWDIAQVPPDMIRRHSNRTREVLETAEHLGVHSVEGRAALGATTRQSKKHVPPGFDIAAHFESASPTTWPTWTNFGPTR